MAATTVILAAAWGCSDNGNTGPNTNPTASFQAPACIAGTACAFTDASTDADGTVTAWSWNFNDGTALDVNRNPSHTFATAGTFNVTLTVTDNAGGTGSTTVPVTVTGGSANQAPVADFSPPACSVSVPCAFADASTDDVGVTAWSWNFGDGTAPDNTQNPTHTFGTAGAYQVTLTVTDAGGLTNALTKTVTVTDAASQDCASAGDHAVACTLTMTQRSTVTVTLTSTSCEIKNDKVTAVAPTTVGAPKAGQPLWLSVCTAEVGDQVTIQNTSAGTLTLEAGEQLVITLTRGEPDLGDPAAGQPAARFTGTGPWIVNMDDGGNTAAPGEPDFDDVVLTVTPTAAP
jgi:PKD repeat protein